MRKIKNGVIETQMPQEIKMRDEAWNSANQSLENALKRCNIPYKIIRICFQVVIIDRSTVIIAKPFICPSCCYMFITGNAMLSNDC